MLEKRSDNKHMDFIFKFLFISCLWSVEHILEFWESTLSQQNNCVFFPTNKFSEKEIQIENENF